MRRRLLFIVLALALGAGPACAADVVGVQFREWSFSDGNDMHDAIVYANVRWLHLQLERWDFERGQDQVRPEVGVVFKDHRRSAYTAQWRGERLADRYWIGTEQVVGEHWVLRGEVSPIVRRDASTLTVWDVGADVYWASYSLAGVTVIRDPRGDDLWVVPVRARFASESNDWVQVTVAPASRRTVGWALDGKWHWIRAGVERNSRFDFTNVDNTIWTLGLEWPIHRPQ